MSQPFTSTVLRDARRIVVKVGSSLVTNEGRGLDEAAIGEWCRQMAILAKDGREVIMVSSGAIAEGMKRLGWATRPVEIHALQAAAAVLTAVQRRTSRLDPAQQSMQRSLSALRGDMGL